MPKKTYANAPCSTELLEMAAEAWSLAKAKEYAAIEERRETEDYLAKVMLQLSEELDSSLNYDAGLFDIKVTGRLNRKVDAERLEQLANENGLKVEMENLFRWKAEINMGEWKKASPAITGVLSMAITTTPGRPSFDVTRKEI